jgi:hypothetical protein
MMPLLISICLAMSITGFILSNTGRDIFKSLMRAVKPPGPPAGRPITRSHAMAAARIVKTRSFGKR